MWGIFISHLEMSFCSVSFCSVKWNHSSKHLWDGFIFNRIYWITQFQSKNNKGKLYFYKILVGEGAKSKMPAELCFFKVLSYSSSERVAVCQ